METCLQIFTWPLTFELGGMQSVMGRVTFAIIGVSWMCQGTGRPKCFVLTMYTHSNPYPDDIAPLVISYVCGGCMRSEVECDYIVPRLQTTVWCVKRGPTPLVTPTRTIPLRITSRTTLPPPHSTRTHPYAHHLQPHQRHPRPLPPPPDTYCEVADVPRPPSQMLSNDKIVTFTHV